MDALWKGGQFIRPVPGGRYLFVMVGSVQQNPELQLRDLSEGTRTVWSYSLTSIKTAVVRPTFCLDSDGSILLLLMHSERWVDKSDSSVRFKDH